MITFSDPLILLVLGEAVTVKNPYINGFRPKAAMQSAQGFLVVRPGLPPIPPKPDSQRGQG